MLVFNGRLRNSEFAAWKQWYMPFRLFNKLTHVFIFSKQDYTVRPGYPAVAGL
jgi:hypothetical protein